MTTREHNLYFIGGFRQIHNVWNATSAVLTLNYSLVVKKQKKKYLQMLK
jgi:hypothetical protein